MAFNFSIIVYLSFGIMILNAQNFTSQQLIDKWNTEGINQTIIAEETYSDLKYNYDSVIYQRVVSEIGEYLKKNKNPRLEVRFKIYQILKSLQSKEKLSPKTETELVNLFQKAITLKDQQLLSELYSLYAENGKRSFEDNLFYIIKSIEIQEEIGTEYFPKFYMRMFFAGSSYHNLSMYRESIHFINKSLKNLEKPENNLGIYVLNMDLLGSSYYRLNKIDSGMYCYRQIYNQLRDYNINYKNYKEGFQNYNSPFFNVWVGISQGGIAKGLVMQEKYDEALPYLEYNVVQSQKYNQPNDVAKAQNLMAEIYFNRNNTPKALELRHSALKNALKKNTLREAIFASRGLEDIFKQQGRFDSAYFYNEKKHFFEKEMSQAINQSKFLSVTNRLQHEKMQNTLEQAEHQITRQTNTRNLILLCSSVILGSILILYYRYRQKQQLKFIKLNQKKEIAEKNYQATQQTLLAANQELMVFRKKLQQNNLLMESMKSDTKKTPNYSELQTATILTKEDWLNFMKQFNQVYPNYIYSLREVFPHLSQAEIRYLCLVKLNLRQNEIASALGISDSSIRVTWHRMRKKLEPENPSSPEEFLRNFEKKLQFNY